jgi:hypothetical protein
MKPFIAIIVLATTCGAQTVRLWGRDYSEEDLMRWHKSECYTYACADGVIVAVDGSNVRLVAGTVSQTLAGKPMLVSCGSEMVALDVPNVDKIADGDSVRLLGMACGHFEYTSVIGAPKRLRRYGYVPCISYAQFRKMLVESHGEAFPRMKASALEQARQEAGAGAVAQEKQPKSENPAFKPFARPTRR